MTQKHAHRRHREQVPGLRNRAVLIRRIYYSLAALVAVLVRMISRNQRAVEEATMWLKRIVITWVILNTLGFIIAYLQP